MSVLIVDDDAEVRTSMDRALRAGGYEVASMDMASTAETLLALLLPEQLGETLVLLDVSLGAADAYPDGCAAGRAFATRWPPLRLLFISGHDARSLETRCPGHPPYLLKPIGREDLLAMVALMLRAPPWRPPLEHDHRRKGDR